MTPLIREALVKLAATLLLVLLPALVSAQRQKVDSVVYRSARPPAYCEELTQYDSTSLMFDALTPADLDALDPEALKAMSVIPLKGSGVTV